MGMGTRTGRGLLHRPEGERHWAVNALGVKTSVLPQKKEAGREKIIIASNRFEKRKGDSVFQKNADVLLDGGVENPSLDMGKERDEHSKTKNAVGEESQVFVKREILHAGRGKLWSGEGNHQGVERKD